MKVIAHNKPTLDQQELNAIGAVLRSGWIAQGPEVLKLEKEFVNYLGDKSGQAIALSSGTAALYAALKVLKVKAGDEVIVPTYACSSLLNAIYLAGAQPVIVDINADDLNISFEHTRKKITKKTKAIIVTHTFGHPAEIEKFIKLKIPIIEDCAQAIGSKCRNKRLGTFGKIAIFSFYATKVMTSGYGGLVYSKNKDLVAAAKDYREFDSRKSYKPRFNFMMSDIQAAMARVQLKKLPLFLSQKKAIAKSYLNAFPKDKVWPAVFFDSCQSNYYRFLLKTERVKKVKEHLIIKGVDARIPFQKFELLHRYLHLNPKNFPVAERVASETLSLPIYPSLSSKDIKRIILSVKEVL